MFRCLRYNSNSQYAMLDSDLQAVAENAAKLNLQPIVDKVVRMRVSAVMSAAHLFMV